MSLALDLDMANYWQCFGTRTDNAKITGFSQATEGQFSIYTGRGIPGRYSLRPLIRHLRAGIWKPGKGYVVTSATRRSSTVST